MNVPFTTRRDRWWLIGWSLLLFAASAVLFARHNSFPYHYHPDEPGKVEQVIDAKWNFHHPMLLLGVTRAVVEFAPIEKREQPVVEAGRWVSAAFMAASAVALSLLAYAWRGWQAALATGSALALHHQLYELAHYFKEDSALLLGLALSFLMLLAVWWRPSPARVALLGVACGLAISGKYLGVIAAAMAVAVLWQRIRVSRESSGASFHLALFPSPFAQLSAPAIFGVFTLSLLGALLVTNWPMIADAATFRESFGREVELVAKGQGGLTRRVPHAQYWNVFIDNTTPAMWALLAIFLHARWKHRRDLIFPEKLLIAFPFAFAVALSFSPKSNDRYFLPATALLVVLAAIGTVDFARLFRRGAPRAWAAIGALAMLIFGQVIGFYPAQKSWLEYEEAFQHDDNAALIEWLKKEAPPEAVVARDNRIQLPDPLRKKHASRLGVVPQKIINRDAKGKTVKFAADIGTIDELKKTGVTHVAVSESDYGRFFLRGLKPQETAKADFQRQKAFYERLFREEELVFERDRGTVIYLHPGIRVYRLTE